MNATDELRRLLDERGVKHYDHENGEPLRVLEKAEGHATSWRIDGASCCAVPDGKGTFDVWIDHCTPEQAIAATLGAGTCHVVSAEKLVDSFGFKLSCVHSMVNPFNFQPDYCPWCGAKVVV